MSERPADLGSAREPTLLIADDNPTLLRALVAMLRGEGFDVVGSTVSGLGAVLLAKSLRPDLVLIDVRMPGLDGIEASRLIREACPSSEVVIYSAFDDPGLRKEAAEAGIADYLMKGCKPTLIVEALRRALQRGHRSSGVATS